MSDLLRDPIWQFVGSIIALVALVVSVYVFLLQRRRKSLCYQVLTETNVLTVDEEIKGKIKILFDETPIQDASLIILKVMNDGNLPISAADFERPITFSFGDSSIISADIIMKSPTTLRPELYTRANQIELQPALLNSKDSITVKLLIAQYKRVIVADARILGVTEVKKIESKTNRIGVVPLLLGLPVLVVIVSSLLQSFEGIGLSLFQSILPTLTICVMVAVFVMLLAKEYRGHL